MSIAAVKKIMKDAKGLGMMATVDGVTPRVRPMYGRLDAGNVLHVSTFVSSPKMRQLARNPMVEFCFIDSAQQHVRLSGRMKVITSQKAKEAFFRSNKGLKDYFASADDPSFALLELKPSKVQLMLTGGMKYHTIKF